MKRISLSFGVQGDPKYPLLKKVTFPAALNGFQDSKLIPYASLETNVMFILQI
jgi:hypothetical protein